VNSVQHGLPLLFSVKKNTGCETPFWFLCVLGLFLLEFESAMCSHIYLKYLWKHGYVLVCLTFHVCKKI
jgi:hypothetical protein